MDQPIWLGLPLDHSEAVVTVARWLPLVTLCPPAAGEDCSDVGAAAGVVEWEASDASEDGATIVLEEGADSPSNVDPSLVRTVAGDASGLALVPHDEEVKPRKDPLV